MRASRLDGIPRTVPRGATEVHISGAEGLYPASEMQKVISGYVARALTHPKGMPGKIVVTLERIARRPRLISSLPVCTLRSRTPDESRRIVRKMLSFLGICPRAITRGFSVIEKGEMRGAALIRAGTGIRVDPDRQRGVRVSRLGMTATASALLSRRLSRYGINTLRVKEALTLASKVISHDDIVAEYCVSDDPGYPTGYIATKTFGYTRIPHMKERGSSEGGRVFFVRDGADVADIIAYLETIPVMVGIIAPCRGTRSIDEILGHPHR